MPERLVVVEVSGRTWLLKDECGCGSFDCLASQVYSFIAKQSELMNLAFVGQ